MQFQFYKQSLNVTIFNPKEKKKEENMTTRIETKNTFDESR